MGEILFRYNPIWNTGNGKKKCLCPNPGIYFSVCLALMVISLLETVIITNVLHHSSMKYQEVPRWVRVVVLKHIATLICYRSPVELQPSSSSQKAVPEGGPNGGSRSQTTPAASRASTQKAVSNQGTKAERFILSCLKKISQGSRLTLAC